MFFLRAKLVKIFWKFPGIFLDAIKYLFVYSIKIYYYNIFIEWTNKDELLQYLERIFSAKLLAFELCQVLGLLEFRNSGGRTWVIRKPDLKLRRRLALTDYLNSHFIRFIDLC